MPSFGRNVTYQNPQLGNMPLGIPNNNPNFPLGNIPHGLPHNNPNQFNYNKGFGNLNQQQSNNSQKSESKQDYSCLYSNNQMNFPNMDSSGNSSNYNQNNESSKYSDLYTNYNHGNKINSGNQYNNFYSDHLKGNQNVPQYLNKHNQYFDNTHNNEMLIKNFEQKHNNDNFDYNFGSGLINQNFDNNFKAPKRHGSFAHNFIKALNENPYESNKYLGTSNKYVQGDYGNFNNNKFDYKADMDSINYYTGSSWWFSLRYFKNPIFFQHQSTDIFYFDFNRNQWAQLVNPQGCFFYRNHRAAELPDGSFLITGGELGVTVRTTIHYLNGQFYEKNDMLRPRKAHSSIYVKGFVYNFGGFDDSGTIYYCEKYDTSQESWSDIAEMDYNLAYSGVMNYSNDYIFLFGGYSTIEINGVIYFNIE